MEADIPVRDRNPDRVILESLRSSVSPVSGVSLALRLGVSRVALFRRIEALKAWGYRIESGRRGYTLARDDGLAPADLEESGAERNAAFPTVRVMAQAASTMDAAREWGFRAAPSGAAVLALRQSLGRGRGGRAWKSPPGGLYLSLVLRPGLPVACAGSLVLEAARALLGILEAEGVRGASFRWPNDIVSPRGKLGGLLLESHGGLDRPEFYVLGVGLNVAPLELEDRRAACLDDLATRAPRRRDIAASLARGLRTWCDRPRTEVQRWKALAREAMRPAWAELWDGRILKIRPRGFTSRGELSCSGRVLPLAYGECRKITYEGDEP